MPSDVQTEDPADHDPELRKLLKDSSKTAEEKMAKVIDLTTKLKKHNQNVWVFSSPAISGLISMKQIPLGHERICIKTSSS